jgi:hypothetical protein
MPSTTATTPPGSVGLPGVLQARLPPWTLQPVIDRIGDRQGARLPRCASPALRRGCREGALVTVTAKVGALEGDFVRIDLTVTFPTARLQFLWKGTVSVA